MLIFLILSATKIPRLKRSIFVEDLQAYAFGLASETTILRPSNSELLSFETASFASESEDISTKPNPFERPDILSMITEADSTLPTCSKCDFKVASVVAQAILPTNSLFDIFFNPQRITYVTR